MQLTETRHARTRRQQRAIPAFVVNLLLEQGTCMRHHGADVFFVDKAARRRIRCTLGNRVHAALEAYLDAYIVLSDDGCLITAAWRTGRLHQA